MIHVLHESIDLLINWRFWSFIGIAFSPLWAMLVAVVVAYTQEKIVSYLYNRRN